MARDFRQELVWQPRFAYATAAVILLALTVVSLPLWIVLFRLVGATGTEVGDLIALCMMLMGGFLTSAAAWVIIIEMRGRVRMVDTWPAAATGSWPSPGGARAAGAGRAAGPGLACSHCGCPPEPTGWEPGQPPPPLESRVEAQQVSAAATLEASSKLLGSFSQRAQVVRPAARPGRHAHRGARPVRRRHDAQPELTAAHLNATRSMTCATLA